MRRARLETLVETYRTPVFQYLYRMVDDAAAAERLAEVVFVEAFRSGEGEDGMEIRLFRIATSLAIARGRGGGCRNVPSGGDLLAAVRNLAPVEKAAVILHRYHGFDYAGIGAVLGCSRNAVALILVQAYKSLHTVVLRIPSGHSSAVR